MLLQVKKTADIAGYDIAVCPPNYEDLLADPAPVPTMTTLGAFSQDLWEYHLDWTPIYKAMFNTNDMPTYTESITTGTYYDLFNVTETKTFISETGANTNCVERVIGPEEQPPYPCPVVPGEETNTARSDYYASLASDLDTVEKVYNCVAMISPNFKSFLDKKTVNDASMRADATNLSKAEAAEFARTGSPFRRAQIISALQPQNIVHFWDNGGATRVYLPFRISTPENPFGSAPAGDYRFGTFVAFPTGIQPSGPYTGTNVSAEITDMPDFEFITKNYHSVFTLLFDPLRIKCCNIQTWKTVISGIKKVVLTLDS